MNIFKKIISREIPAYIIYEDDEHIAFLDIHPFDRGHTLVVPKKEYETILDMPEDEYLTLQKLVLKIACHIESKLGGGINIIQNNKTIADQSVLQVHVHIIPRLEMQRYLYTNESLSLQENEMEELRNTLSF